jgi:hypothetical protein
VAVPQADDRANPQLHQANVFKPLPQEGEQAQLPPPPFNDPPLISEPPPEQAPFLDAYNRVGKPRITLFVNRTLEGKIIPVKSGGANDYLKPGQYDEASDAALDYEAIENTLTDILDADGQVTMISPSVARQKLSDEQVKDLQNGRPQVLSEVAEELNADILIQIQIHPTKQTRNGLEVRLVAEAINTKGGVSLARAIVDIPPPLDKPEINKYSRWVARKLMDGMTASWLLPPDSGNSPTTAPAQQ